jgi:hypothetical protein
MNHGITRRDALVAALAAAIAAAGAGGFPAAVYGEASVTLDQFLALSSRLTGATNLDAAIGKVLLGAFLSIGKEAGLARLAAGEDGADKDLAAAIVAAWYSGLCDSASGPVVATFDQALLWQALSFTKPFGECGGSTGYWSDPPQP